MKTIAIVGGGFCGTLTAVNLARLTAKSLRIMLVNHQYPTGRGVAYGTLRPEHLLNVVARNMSAFPDLPSHFVDWLANRADFAQFSPAELREQFVPRRVYGDYLQDLLFWQCHPLGASTHAQIQLIDDEVVDVTPDGAGALLKLKSGSNLEADHIVLATGNLSPHSLIRPGPLHDHPAYRANPWCALEEKLPDHREDVLLVGTGLTMIDLFLTLNAMGWAGRIIAVSRTGLLPLPHFKGSDYNEFPPENVESLGLQALVALTEEHCRRLRAKGMNPALVVDRLRPFTQRIWRKLSVEEKREFSREYRTRWNVNRHRIPPAVAGLIEAAVRDAKLQVLKGKLGDIRGDGSRLTVTIDHGATQPVTVLSVGLLVNCTGPRDSFNDAPDDLWRKLFERGLVRPDELDMGIEVTPDFAVVDHQGQPSQFLFAIGSLLKGTLWETTAVPELRAQTHQVAKALVADESRHEPDWAQETPANLIEYYI